MFRSFRGGSISRSLRKVGGVHRPSKQEQLSEQARQRAIKIIQEDDFTSPPGSAVYFSANLSKQQIEAELEERSHLYPFSSTPGGQKIMQMGLFAPDSPLSFDDAKTVWALALRRYVEEAKGTFNLVGNFSNEGQRGLFRRHISIAIRTNPSIHYVNAEPRENFLSRTASKMKALAAERDTSMKKILKFVPRPS